MRTSRTVSASILSLALCLAASEARAQRPLGNDIRVNTHTAGTQWVPDVATAEDGSFVVVWRDGTSASAPSYVMARRFDAAGRPRSGEIRVARVTTQVFGRPAVAVVPDGGFVVVWAGGQEDPGLGFGRRFASDGTPIGSRFRLARIGGQQEPDIAVAEDGSFTVVWSQAVLRGREPDLDIYLRRFRADGRPRGVEIPLVSGELEESAPRIDLRPGGGFALAWNTWGGESSFFDVRAQLFSDAGAPESEELLVNEGPSFEASQYSPSLAVATDGSFAIVWSDRGGDDVPFDPDDGLAGTGVKARFYEADGAPRGPERSVNSFKSGLQELAEIAATPTGGYFVIWASGSSSADGVSQDGDGYGIFGRAYGVDGTRQSREIRINRNPAGSQYLPALDIAPSGKGAVGWIAGSGPDSDIFARRLGGPR